MDIEQWSVIWLSLKEVLLLIEFFHESSTYWKAAQCTEARECRWPFKTCFASARAFLIWEQQQTVTVSYLCCCSSLLRIELRYKTLADKKKHFVSQWEREQRYTVTTEENILFNLWTKDFNLWEGVDINTVQDTGRWFGSAVLTFVRNCAFLCLTKSVRISLLKKKKIHITIYEVVVILIFSVRVSENVVFFFDENFYCLIIG